MGAVDALRLLVLDGKGLLVLGDIARVDVLRASFASGSDSVPNQFEQLASSVVGGDSVARGDDYRLPDEWVIRASADSPQPPAANSPSLYGL